jgi:hypothetical protein
MRGEFTGGKKLNIIINTIERHLNWVGNDLRRCECSFASFMPRKRCSCASAQLLVEEEIRKRLMMNKHNLHMSICAWLKHFLFPFPLCGCIGGRVFSMKLSYEITG